MCGRFVLAVEQAALQREFNLVDLPMAFAPRYNIAPTQPVAMIGNDAPQRLTFASWGLIPSWSKDAAIAAKTFNARAETLHEKPSFKSAFRRRRCLIPASGFYEWSGGGKHKQPVYIHLKDEPVFAFAGLWEEWHSPAGDLIRSCTVITTEPNDLIKSYHHRMAVILERSDYADWLDPDERPYESLQPLLRSFPAEKMALYEVSTLVNSVDNDTPECIIPLNSIPPQQPTLF